MKLKIRREKISEIFIIYFISCKILFKKFLLQNTDFKNYFWSKVCQPPQVKLITKHQLIFILKINEFASNGALYFAKSATSLSVLNWCRFYQHFLNILNWQFQTKLTNLLIIWTCATNLIKQIKNYFNFLFVFWICRLKKRSLF